MSERQHIQLGAEHTVVDRITDLVIGINSKPIEDIMDAVRGVPQTGKPRRLVTERMIEQDREAAAAVGEAIRIMLGSAVSLAYQLGAQHGTTGNRGEYDE